MTSWAVGLRVLERYGFAAVACLGIAWFANSAIEFERTKMEPTIQENSKAIERNTEVMRQLPTRLTQQLSKPETNKDKESKHDP